MTTWRGRASLPRGQGTKNIADDTIIISIAYIKVDALNKTVHESLLLPEDMERYSYSRKRCRLNSLSVNASSFIYLSYFLNLEMPFFHAATRFTHV